MVKPKNFKFLEMIATKSTIPNTPATWEQLENINYVANKLQSIRDELHKPIVVTSGFRTPKLNTYVGGSRSSAHLKGLAADITCKKKVDNEKLLHFIQKHKHVIIPDQVIVYRDASGTIRWIHLGFTTILKRPRLQFIEKSV